jgi:chromate transporter
VPRRRLRRARVLRVHAGLVLLGKGGQPAGTAVQHQPICAQGVRHVRRRASCCSAAPACCPAVQEIVVDGHGWVSQREFIDAVAMGQITPGPVLVSAAFVGLKVAGLAGAVLATLGIYLPSALLMLGSIRVLDRIKRSAAVRAALQGVRPAVVGMIAAAAWSVGSSASVHWASLLIFAAALAALLRFRLDVVWVIPPAGVAGLLLF